MSMTDWAYIASDIRKYYAKFDAFVILHGTDTMAYTASALSFMLENLGKTVILTGSQVSNRKLLQIYMLHVYIRVHYLVYMYC